MATIKDISMLAHQYWIEEGCPDGEKPAYDFEGCTIKLKEVHWERAKAMLELKENINKQIRKKYPNAGFPNDDSIGSD